MLKLWPATTCGVLYFNTNYVSLAWWTKDDPIDASNFMADTITELDALKASSDMKAQVELLIMKTQVRKPPSMCDRRSLIQI